MKKHHVSDLSYKLIKNLLVFLLIISTITVGIQLYVDYRRDLNELSNSLRVAEETSTPAIQNALWEYSGQQVELQIEGLVKLPDIAGAKLVYGTDNRQKIIRGEVDPSNSQKREITLTASLFDESLVIGKLTLYGDIDAVNQRTTDRFLVIIASQGVKTFTLVWFIVYLVNRLIISRVLTISHWAEESDNEKSYSPLPTVRQGKLDEIDYLHDYLDKMAESVFEYSNQLESKVEKRTIELQSAKVVAENALITAEKATEAKSDFLAKMSHEIRTPLNAVIGLSHLTLKTTSNQRQRNNLENILASSEVLLGLINDILDFSKIEAGKLSIEATSFDLNTIIQRAVGLSALKAQEKGIELITYISPEVPTKLIGDPLRLQQIITNLCSNSVKFTETGNISIIVTSTPSPEGMKLNISIRDTGIGMSTEQMSRLFQSFNQADNSTTRKYGGTGLGLTICKQLCELMGGEISVDSKPLVGTTFSFFVILKEDKQSTSTVDMSNIDVAGLNVLVIDDIELARKVIQDALHKYGIHADTASNGNQGLELIRKSQNTNQQYDIVFLDWKMPGIDGVGVLQEMAKVAPSLPAKTILLSSHDIDDLKVISKPMGVNHFLEKPINQSYLYDALISAISGKNTETLVKPNVANAPKLLGHKILLVEDNKLNQQVACGFLSDTHVEIDIAENGLEALDLLSIPNDYSLVFMDIQMPVMNGLVATQKIRELGVDIPIIAMTAHAMAGDVEKSLKAGMNAHINKPIDISELYDTLSQHLYEPQKNQINKSIDNQSLARPSILIACESMENIDVNEALKKLGGKEELFVQMLQTFVREQNLKHQLSQSLQSNDLELTYRIAHSLKTNASYIGAIELSRLSLQLEQYIESDPTGSRLRLLVSQVVEMFDKVHDELASLPLFNDTITDAVPFEKKQALQLIQSALDAAQIGSTETAEFAKDLMNMCANTPFVDDAKACYQNFDDYEFESGVKKLHALRERII